MNQNWIVRAYDAAGKIVESWKIDNRQEHEAEREAMADIRRVVDYADWSMMRAK